MNSSQISFGLAFVAGLISFLSPCMLPLVPIFLAQLVGQSAYQSTGGQADRPASVSCSVRYLAWRLPLRHYSKESCCCCSTRLGWVCHFCCSVSASIK